MLDAPKTSFATPFSGLSTSTNVKEGEGKSEEGEGDVWFDWSFCEFWKMNFCTFVSRSFPSLFPRLLLPFLVLPLPVSRLLSLRPFRFSGLRPWLVVALCLCVSFLLLLLLLSLLLLRLSLFAFRLACFVPSFGIRLSSSRSLSPSVCLLRFQPSPSSCVHTSFSVLRSPSFIVLAPSALLLTHNHRRSPKSPLPRSRHNLPSSRFVFLSFSPRVPRSSR